MGDGRRRNWLEHLMIWWILDKARLRTSKGNVCNLKVEQRSVSGDYLDTRNNRGFGDVIGRGAA
ncbi:MAG: hypothetical protein KJ872_07205 [Alphaproteobacteria bacterium]|nr:hypothetical protein [Alphaproteobacteria bacterium]